jgi:nicotinate-nucleotide adenylyltransferase
MSRPQRIGILGGTFDPVHIAHLHIAACAKHDLALDEVRFVPAGAPPHKPGVPVSDATDRLRMLEIATAGVDGFTVDPIDLAAHEPSYTSELLARIRTQHPNDDLWFIVGADSLSDFHTWHQPTRILSLARLAVAMRPGWDITEALDRSTIRDLSARVDAFSSVPIDLSATLIRERLRAGLPVDWLLPRDVLAYIDERGLFSLSPIERR